MNVILPMWNKADVPLSVFMRCVAHSPSLGLPHLVPVLLLGVRIGHVFDMPLDCHRMKLNFDLLMHLRRTLW